jgi:hypothetical protein
MTTRLSARRPTTVRGPPAGLRMTVSGRLIWVTRPFWMRAVVLLSGER